MNDNRYKSGDELHIHPSPHVDEIAVLDAWGAAIANAAATTVEAELNEAALRVDPERLLHRQMIDPRNCAFVMDFTAALRAADKEGDK